MPFPESIQALRLLLMGSRIGAWAKRLGVGRVALSLHERHLLRTGRHSLALGGERLTFAVRSANEVGCIDNFARHERTLIERMLASVREGDTVFDVGANIGIVSVALGVVARLRSVSVHAFEPDPRTAERTRANADLNLCENVYVHTLALGAKSGTAWLHTSREHPDTASMIQRLESGMERLAVCVERADDVARALRLTPSVIKIDVEGAEFDVLRGAEAMLRAGVVRDLFVEIHPERLSLANHDEGEIVDWLAGLGYRSVWRQVKQDEPQHHFRHASAGSSPRVRGESGRK